MNLPIKRTDPAATLPTRAHPTDAGLDLHALHDVTLYASGRAIVPTGIAVAIPVGYVGMVCPRSGVATQGVTVNNAPGIVDSGYTGELKVILINHSRNPWHAKAGDRIAQLVILPIVTPGVVEVDELPGTQRGNNGFGSTGR